MPVIPSSAARESAETGLLRLSKASTAARPAVFGRCVSEIASMADFLKLRLAKSNTAALFSIGKAFEKEARDVHRHRHFSHGAARQVPQGRAQERQAGASDRKWRAHFRHRQSLPARGLSAERGHPRARLSPHLQLAQLEIRSAKRRGAGWPRSR